MNELALRLEDVHAFVLKDVLIEKDAVGLASVAPDRVTSVRDAMIETGVFAKSSDAMHVSVCLRYMFASHYFHLMEAVLVIFAMKEEYFPQAQVRKIYVGAMPWPAVNVDVMQALFPGAVIVTDVKKEAVKSLIYIDLDYMKTDINKFIDPVLILVAKWGPTLRDRVFRYLGVTPRSNAAWRVTRPRCLYARRFPPRAFSPEDEARLMARLSSTMEVSIGEFSATAWADQVRAAAGSDMMVGIHGNALTNLLWLPPHATVIEFFPEDTHHYDYQMMCEVMSLNYFGIEKSAIFRPLSRSGPAYGHGTAIQKEVALPSDTMLDFVLAACTLSCACCSSRIIGDEKDHGSVLDGGLSSTHDFGTFARSAWRAVRRGIKHRRFKRMR